MDINLSYGLKFEDLYSTSGLAKIHDKFLESNPPEELLRRAEAVEDFVAELFNIRSEVSALKAQHDDLAPLSKAKKLFFQRAAKKFAANPDNITNDLQFESELKLAKDVLKWMDLKDEENLTKAALYAASLTDKERAESIIFNNPKKLDYENLVCKDHIQQRDRDGFSLTDDGGSLERALDQANYCIFCHPRGKDSCSKGIWKEPEDGSRTTPSASEGKAIEAVSHAALELKPKTSATNVPLAGCPLDEKISEMNLLKADGFSIAALAVVTLDNPMCAATGHRICNDCMKSCIYQKQEPVDIPQIESRNLRDVLALPFGFEIYSLLTRWNPLSSERPIPKVATDKKVLIVGLGPAGFTLAHHLLNDGHEVFAIDGLKIEPLDIPFEPIEDWNEIWEDLNKRKPQGFGGVTEYGITVRWDKNFLTIIRLLIERRENFAYQGGCRFGSNITKAQAFEMGFDHIAMCAGAGKPNVINMKNAMARGVRTASDFLMSLQSGGAFREESLTNLTVRTPIVVIGGGLTAIDTCTEAKAYYGSQKTKFKDRYEFLVKHRGVENVHARWNAEEEIIAQELLNDDDAESTIIYRKRLQDSPAYRLNHEEVEKAFEEGIGFIENATPLEVILDEFGHAKAIKINRDGIEETILARTILIAAGTQPNTVLASEEDDIELDGKYFQMLDEDGNLAKPTGHCKPTTTHVLMQSNMSFFGDLHPDFAGNVVKAMASAKKGYPVISKLLEAQKPTSKNGNFKNDLSAHVHEVNRLAPRIIEVVVNAPLAARNFQPGQFYKLQNFEANNPLASEPMAMTGAWKDNERGLLGMIILEMGGSSDLCAHFKTGEEIVLMGPTGTPTEIPQNEDVVLCGGGLGNAVLFSIGKAMRENGCNVTYFAGYKNPEDRYKTPEIEAAADTIIWACDTAELPKTREQDHTFKGNMIEAMIEYGELTKDAARLVVIGSDRMMAAVAYERHHKLKEFLPNCKIGIGSINSPMQCMMKEVCAQCLQRHVDPETGAESYVYSCFNQDQCLDTVDFDHLNSRLKQNKLQEDLTSQWIDLQLKERKLRDNVA